MEIYRDILKLREDFFKNFDLDEIKKLLDDTKFEKLPIIDNISDEKISKIIKIIEPKNIILKLMKKYDLKLDENFSDFEEKIVKILEGDEIDIDEEKLNTYEIIFRVYGIPFTSIWRAIKDKIELSNFDENFCPICGGSFDYAYIDEEGKKFLVCDLCRFPWRYARVKCPICENEDQNKLSYLQFEGDYEFVRIYQCENCSESHKVLLVDKIKKYPSVELANIETIPLEFAIDEK